MMVGDRGFICSRMCSKLMREEIPVNMFRISYPPMAHAVIYLTILSVLSNQLLFFPLHYYYYLIEVAGARIYVIRKKIIFYACNKGRVKTAEHTHFVYNLPTFFYVIPELFYARNEEILERKKIYYPKQNINFYEFFRRSVDCCYGSSNVFRLYRFRTMISHFCRVHFYRKHTRVVYVPYELVVKEFLSVLRY